MNKYSNEFKLEVVTYYLNNNFLCIYSEGRYFNPKRFSATFHELLKENNLHIIRLHNLRHSYTSLLIKLGIQPKEISSMLGHKNIGITMGLYPHLYENIDKEVAKIFDKIINI